MIVSYSKTAGNVCYNGKVIVENGTITKIFTELEDGNQGDVLVGISTSGNSKNVLNAIQVARDKGMKVIGLTGKTGGEMAGKCDVEIRAPYSEFADRAQEIHIKVIHSLIDFVEHSL